jgi:hypothetical protein
MYFCFPVTIDKELVEPTEEEIEEYGLDQAPPPDPMNAELINNLRADSEQKYMQVEKMIAEIKNKEADTEKKLLEAQKVSVESMNILADAIVKKINAGLPLTGDDQELIEGQSKITEETQEDYIKGNEFAGSLPVGEQMQPPAMEAAGIPVGPQTPVEPIGTPQVVTPTPYIRGGVDEELDNF